MQTGALERKLWGRYDVTHSRINRCLFPRSILYYSLSPISTFFLPSFQVRSPIASQRILVLLARILPSSCADWHFFVSRLGFDFLSFQVEGWYRMILSLYNNNNVVYSNIYAQQYIYTQSVLTPFRWLGLGLRVRCCVIWPAFAPLAYPLRVILIMKNDTDDTDEWWMIMRWCTRVCTVCGKCVPLILCIQQQQSQ